MAKPEVVGQTADQDKTEYDSGYRQIDMQVVKDRAGATDDQISVGDACRQDFSFAVAAAHPANPYGGRLAVAAALEPHGGILQFLIWKGRGLVAGRKKHRTLCAGLRPARQGRKECRRTS
ncbi:hypothetical protein [Sulfuritalea sp.]|uniref:hypothetical protein n=1 Tax=Sulfuritalea sp. TaxID=2480090 RepID=UPI00286D6D78|nr:hypothetical protein [Sulfuritalea sp.]